MRAIITSKYYKEYNTKQRYTLAKHVRLIKDTGLKATKLAFIRSSVFSSLIEGSAIDLDNYLFNKEVGYTSKNMTQIDDVVKAYQFAKTHALTQKNVLKAHAILSNNFEVLLKYKGNYRDRNVYIKNNVGKTIYTAAPIEILPQELTKFYNDLDSLLKKKNYTLNEAFYYASFIHLVFVNIHPFADGNGRISRLLEKWFLAKIIGDKAWHIPTEVNYNMKLNKYYQNLNIVGSNYSTNIDYSYAMPFLLMLPTAFGISKKYYKE